VVETAVSRVRVVVDGREERMGYVTRQP